LVWGGTDTAGLSGARNVGGGKNNSSQKRGPIRKMVMGGGVIGEGEGS